MLILLLAQSLFGMDPAQKKTTSIARFFENIEKLKFVDNEASFNFRDAMNKGIIGPFSLIRKKYNIPDKDYIFIVEDGKEVSVCPITAYGWGILQKAQDFIVKVPQTSAEGIDGLALISRLQTCFPELYLCDKLLPSEYMLRGVEFYLKISADEKKLLKETARHCGAERMLKFFDSYETDIAKNKSEQK